MDQLDVLVKNGNLIISLPEERGCGRTITLNPAEITYKPQIQFSSGITVVKVVNYQRIEEGSWAPDSVVYQTYKPGSLEYRAFEMIAQEAQAIQQKFKTK